MVQKKAFVVILGREYISYENALTVLKLERLDTRRENISLRFAIKCTQSDRHSSMFPKNPNFRPNTRHPKPFLEPWCSTSRYFNSTIPALTRLLNENSVNSNQWTSYLIQTLPTTIAIYSRQKQFCIKCVFPSFFLTTLWLYFFNMYL